MWYANLHLNILGLLPIKLMEVGSALYWSHAISEVSLPIKQFMFCITLIEKPHCAHLKVSRFFFYQWETHWDISAFSWNSQAWFMWFRAPVSHCEQYGAMVQASAMSSPMLFGWRHWETQDSFTTSSCSPLLQSQVCLEPCWHQDHQQQLLGSSALGWIETIMVCSMGARGDATRTPTPPGDCMLQDCSHHTRLC